jgi:hypothetical protein
MPKKRFGAEQIVTLLRQICMGNRPMTRLTNAFSKKAENLSHMMEIYFMHYNFVRIHQTLKVTPAMAAEVTPKLWEMSDTNGPEY